MVDEIRARVFISCGQQKATDEVEVAHKIGEKLYNDGFEPYIAVEEQTLLGVTENLFRRISESEYFLFVDFKREALPDGICRGSLFSHQELAIATFLSKEVLAFQEKGVKEGDGLMKFIQANCIDFMDRQKLPDVVAQQVKERKWDNGQRDELLINGDDTDSEDGNAVIANRDARFFYIRVRNRHKKKMARDCFAYLDRLEDLSTGDTRVPELVEFKWKGVRAASVTIPAGGLRKLDAFHVYEDPQGIAVDFGFNQFMFDDVARDARFYEQYRLRGPGRFALSYIVFSEVFSPARATFTLEVGNSVRDTVFRRSDRQ